MRRVLLALLLVLLLATAVAAAPLDMPLTIDLRPNRPVVLRCTDGDEWIIDDVGGGELVITCRVWLNNSEVSN